MPQGFRCNSRIARLPRTWAKSYHVLLPPAHAIRKDSFPVTSHSKKRVSILSRNTKSCREGTRRIASFDCLKWFAVVMVVVGHCVDLATSNSNNYRAIFIFIYAFHMPLFIFVSGLFDHFRESFPKRQVLFFLYIGLLLKVTLSVIKGITRGVVYFSLLSEVDVAWFMFSLAAWRAACYILRNCRPILIGALSILVALLFGYDNVDGDFLCLSRTIVFFPFYYAGYCLSPGKVHDVLHKPRYAIIGMSIICVFLAICFTNVDAVYQFRMLFTGRNPYSTIPIADCSWVHRALCYVVSAVLSLAFVSVFTYISNSTIAKLGQRTLSVYF